MVSFIYSNPTWLWGGLFVLGITGLACLGVSLTNRWIDPGLRKQHNEVTAATMGIVGVAYAVLLAFIAVATWEKFSGADKIIDVEASYIADLYRETMGLPEGKSAPVRAAIKVYLDQVVGEEWPSQQNGVISQAGRPTLVRIQSLIAAIDPKSPAETVIVEELLRTMNALYDARRSRILAADSAIPEIVWWITAFGTTITLGLSFLFGAERRMHFAITGLIAASMALVIVLIVSLDRPFRGDLSVTVEAYDNARGSIAGVDALR